MVTQEKKDRTILNLANGLTFLRMLLAPFFMLAILKSHFEEAFIIILVATITDFLDGHIARTWKMHTRLGKMLDPLADKIIITFAVIALFLKSGFPIWAALIIILRDLILMTGSIIFLHKHKKKDLTPNFLGKLTTFLQMSAIILFILNIPTVIKMAALIIAVFVTLLSAAVYFNKGYRLFFTKRRKPRINLPNKITLFRVILIPIFIVILLINIPYRRFIATVVFIILALSDALDGYLARKRKQVTSFGKLIDPLADKLLIASALIFLIGKGIDAWMAYTIIAREFAVTGLRMAAINKNQVLPSRWSGKVKTVVQVIAITAVLLNLNIPGWDIFAWWLMLITVLITVYSGVEYFWLGRNLFKELS